jgi:hypothetical protein
MKARAIVTLSNENAPSRFSALAHPQLAADAAVGAARAASRAVLLAPSMPSEEPAVLGLRAHRLDPTRRRNNRSLEREE